MTLTTYNATMSPFWEQWKAAITPELKIQAIDLGIAIAKTLPKMWQLIALALLGILKATVKVPKV